MPPETGSVQSRRVAITGASGLVGRALSAALAGRGDQPLQLVRQRERASPTRIYWNPATGEIDRAALEGVDAVVGLAGESLASGRWTEERKARMWSSRVDGTRLIAETLAGLERKPSVFVSASAIGYYGERGEDAVDEGSAAGTGYLADLCRAWEQATEPARAAGIRVVRLRFGIVLSREDGMLPRMLLPFRLGLGGRLGDGTQYFSWIALDDAVRVVLRAIDDPALDGAVNAVAPHPVPNAEMTQALGRAIGRPTPFAVPAFALKLAMGEMADEALRSTRVMPQRLQAVGFEFAHPEIEGALRAALDAR